MHRLTPGLTDVRKFTQWTWTMFKQMLEKKKPNHLLTGHHHWVREETEEEAADRLSLRQLEEPQLLGVQILLLRVPRHPQRSRCVVYLFNPIFFILNVVGACETFVQDQSAFPSADCVFRFVYLDLYLSGDQLHSHLQVRCSWWIAFSTAHSSLLGLKSYHLRSEIKKIGSIQWWVGNLIESARPLFWHQED